MNSAASPRSVSSDTSSSIPYGPRLFLEYNQDVIGEFGSEQPNGALISSSLGTEEDIQTLSLRIDNYRRGSYPIRVTVEDILGLEKYGAFAVAANTVAMFPLPGVRKCIQEKQSVPRMTENDQKAETEIRIKASISRIISVPNAQQQKENEEHDMPLVGLPSFAFALDSQAPSDLSPLFRHMKSYSFQVLECSEAFKLRWTRKLSVKLVSSGQSTSTMPLSRRLQPRTAEEYTRPSETISLNRFHEAEAGRKAALRKINTLTEECDALRRESDSLHQENADLRTRQHKLVAEMSNIKEDQMQKRLRIYTLERDIRHLRELVEVKENVKEEEEVALILKDPVVDERFSFAMADPVVRKRKSSRDGGRAEVPSLSGGSFTRGPLGSIALNGQVPIPFKFARGRT